MRYLKNYLLICLICLLILKSEAKTNFTYSKTPYSTEQLTLINNAFDQPYFLIGDQLIKLNAKNFILTNFNTLQLNTYLSGFNNSSFLLKNAGFTIQNSLKRNLLNLTNYHFVEAINYCYNGLYSLAIASFEKSLISAYRLKDFKKITLINVNLCHIYLLKNDLSKAEKSNKIALMYYKLSNDYYILINLLITKAQIALLNKSYKNAENFILRNALLLSYKSGSKKNEQQCYFELGKIYLKSKRYTEAKWFFIQSYTLANKLNLRLSKIKSLLLLAKVKNLIKDHSLALQDLLLVKKMSDNSTKEYQSDLQLELAQTYSYLADQVKSHQNLLNFNAIRNDYLLQKL